MKGEEFNRRFLEFKSSLYAYILGFVKDEVASEDLLQDLYLKLWAKKGLIKRTTCKSYFFSSAKHTCIDALRKIKREQEADFSLLYREVRNDETEKNELQMLFRKAVNDLPGNQREVLYLKDICDFSTEEVVNITGYSDNNIRVCLSRGRANVKEKLLKIYNYENVGKK